MDEINIGLKAHTCERNDFPTVKENLLNSLVESWSFLFSPKIINTLNVCCSFVPFLLQ